VPAPKVLTTNPFVESWGHFPNAKSRLLSLLIEQQPKGNSVHVFIHIIMSKILVISKDNFIIHYSNTTQHHQHHHLVIDSGY
jgi:hypothetical protein